MLLSADALQELIHFKETAIGDHTLYPHRGGNVVQRVSRDNHQVGEFAWLYSSGIETQRLGRIHRRRLERLERSHPGDDIGHQLAVKVERKGGFQIRLWPQPATVQGGPALQYLEALPL